MFTLKVHMSLGTAIHLQPLAPEGRLGEAVLRRGGRVFRVATGPTTGDLLVSLPAAPGPLLVLAPKGLGRALLARGAGPWKAEGSGERCVPARWTVAGGAAAWVRRVVLPRGPTDVVQPGTPPVGQPGAWICVAPVDPMWAAARVADPAAGHGAVVLADRWVRAASPAARACGIVRGMSVARARRLCAGLRVLPPVEVQPVWDALSELVEGELGVAMRGRGGLVCPLPRMAPAAGMALATRLVQRAWQAAGVEVRVGIATDLASARALTRVLDAGQVGIVTASAGDVWTRRPRADVAMSGTSWRGAPLPDVEGAITMARGLVRSSRGEPEQVVIRGARSEVVVPVPLGRANVAERVEAALRRQIPMVGAVYAIRLVLPAARRTRQLPLVAGAR